MVCICDIIYYMEVELIERIDFDRLASDEEIHKELFGNLDENIKIIEENFNVKISLKSEFIEILGEPRDIEMVKALLTNLVDIIRKQQTLEKKTLIYSIELIKSGDLRSVGDLLNNTLVYTSMGKPIKAKTVGQAKYIESINNNDIVFGIGPAGTGKTYLAVAAAVREFKNKKVNRIILTRPAVEAGESLGFLPGDLQMKVDPYLRPLYDALFEILGQETYNKYVEKGMIEIAPLAYMRGRTLDSAFIILDEAQNTTNEQMKMFLTRLGYGSKVVVTGDITQIDLPRGKASGLKNVLKILDGVKGIDIIYLGKKDIVRHLLVQRIITAYEKFENRKEIEKKETETKKNG